MEFLLFVSVTFRVCLEETGHFCDRYRPPLSWGTDSDLWVKPQFFDGHLLIERFGLFTITVCPVVPFQM